MQAQPDSLVSPGTETYLQQFEQLRGELPGQDVPWLDELRQSSMNRFDGNIWKVVERAEQQKIDVDSVPRWPTRKNATP